MLEPGEADLVVARQQRARCFIEPTAGFSPLKLVRAAAEPSYRRAPELAAYRTDIANPVSAADLASDDRHTLSGKGPDRRLKRADAETIRVDKQRALNRCILSR